MKPVRLASRKKPKPKPKSKVTKDQAPNKEPESNWWVEMQDEK